MLLNLYLTKYLIHFYYIYFRRNILLFEPYDLGNYFDDFKPYYSEVFRVFYTPEKHFDSVFTSEYIEDAAICQCKFISLLSIILLFYYLQKFINSIDSI